MRAMLRWSLVGVLFLARTLCWVWGSAGSTSVCLESAAGCEIQLLNSSEWLASDLKAGLWSDAFERLG